MQNIITQLCHFSETKTMWLNVFNQRHIQTLGPASDLKTSANMLNVSCLPFHTTSDKTQRSIPTGTVSLTQPALPEITTLWWGCVPSGKRGACVCECHSVRRVDACWGTDVKQPHWQDRKQRSIYSSEQRGWPHLVKYTASVKRPHSRNVPFLSHGMRPVLTQEIQPVSLLESFQNPESHTGLTQLSELTLIIEGCSREPWHSLMA